MSCVYVNRLPDHKKGSGGPAVLNEPAYQLTEWIIFSYVTRQTGIECAIIVSNQIKQQY